MNMNSLYYTKHHTAFIEDTFYCDMHSQYELFLKYMKKNGSILDLGFGSGRDLFYFSSLGYKVSGIDPTEVFVEKMLLEGFDVKNETAQTMNFENEFDGIWACASLLHVPKNELTSTFQNCEKALKQEGILYCSFKYGNKEEERNGRRFTDLNELLLQEYINKTNLKIMEIHISKDVRKDRSNEKWLNCVLKKV